MFPDLTAPFQNVLTETAALLPRLEGRSLLEKNLTRNLALAVGLDRRANLEEIGSKISEIISDLANPAEIKADRLTELGRAAKYLTAALEMARADVVSVPGVELQYRVGDLVFPNGRTLLHVDNHYQSDCPENRSFLFDCETGGLVTLPGHNVIGIATPLFTAEGRILVPVQLDSFFNWGVAELPSAYCPKGHSFVLAGRKITSFYGLYPLSNGKIVAFVRLHTDNRNQYDNQLIDIAENELIQFEERDTYISGPLVYGTEGELFAPIRFKDGPQEQMTTHHGDLLSVVDTIGQQIAEAVSGEILTAGIHTDTPIIREDGTVQVRVWRHTLTEKGEEDQACHIQTLSNPRVESIEPFNRDNFPIGCVQLKFDHWTAKHLVLTHAKPQWVTLPESPVPESPLQAEYRGRWIVTQKGAEKHILRGRAEFMDPPGNQAGQWSVKYHYTKAGGQIAEFCRHNHEAHSNDYVYYDLQTGEQFNVDGSLVMHASKSRVLPDGREIWPLKLKDRGYLILDTATSRLKGIPGMELVYVGGDQALVDSADNFYIKVCCKHDFNDQRFLKV